MTHRIALLPGDGVGPEVVAEARRCVDELGLALEWSELDWGSDHWRHGAMMPPDAVERFALRRRPARRRRASRHPGSRHALGPAAPDPPAARPVGQRTARAPARGRPVRPRGPRSRRRRHALRARELGGRVLGRRRPRAPGPPERGRHRDGRLHARGHRARRRARVRPRGASGAALVTSATKSNASRYGYVLWDEVAAAVAARYPGLRYERVLVDALAARMVLRPDSLDVVVASNLFGDILTDLGAAVQGGMGMAASANLVPGRRRPGPVRARPRLGARHRRPGRREPVRSRLERRPDARAPGRDRRPAARLLAALEDVCREARARAIWAASAGTAEVGEAIRARLRADAPGSGRSASGTAAARARSAATAMSASTPRFGSVDVNECPRTATSCSPSAR